MFRKTNSNPQISLLSGVNQHLTGSAGRRFSDPTAWHNTFYTQVVSKIDEEIFSVLFSEKEGAPNASIKTLIGMMILKEGQGYSDEKLYEDCRFNLLTRKALGLINMDDEIPAESTYYLFRYRISDYHASNQIDLFRECFSQITSEQIIEFNVSGKSLRTDSKLIGSNIAFYSRYELIHKTLLLYYKHILHKQTELLSKENRDILTDFIKEKSASTVYTSDKKEINTRLILLGKLIHNILDTSNESDNKHYKTLKRVFLEQYKVIDDSQIEIIPGKDVSAQSTQSPHDTDCDFRSKNGKKTKGYSHNLTETCDSDNTVDLITDVQVEPASQADNDFVKPAIENSQEILPDKIENLHADGAYNSEDNQEFTDEEDINFYLTGFQGKPGRYDLTIHNGQLQVIDTHTNQEIPVVVTKNNKYRIETEKGYRYFTDKDIESCRLRKQTDELPKKIGNKRNNVEASIFQLAYPLRKDKTKYRGLFKNRVWAILRSLWVNFVRIANNLKETAKNTGLNVSHALHLICFINLFQITPKLTQLELSGRSRSVFWQSYFFTAFWES